MNSTNRSPENLSISNETKIVENFPLEKKSKIVSVSGENDINDVKCSDFRRKNIQIESVKCNPLSEVYQTISLEFSGNPKFDDWQPVAVLHENAEFVVDSLNTSVFVGDHLTDLFQIPSNEETSFVMISNLIQPENMAGLVTKFSQWEDIPKQPIAHLNPSFGLANTMTISNLNDSDSSSKQSKIFVGFDSGNVIMFDDQLSVIETSQFGHSLVTKICMISENSGHLIVGDFDGRLVVVDVENFTVKQCYDYAHYGSINDIVSCLNEFHQVITAGHDCDLLLWDFRLEQKPATKLLNVTTQCTALDWSDEHSITFGTEAGNLVRFDKRNTRKPMHRLSLFTDGLESLRDRSIKRIRSICGERFLAVLADNHHWILDRKTLQTISHNIYNENVVIRSCIDLNGGKDLLTIGNNFGVFHFKNFESQIKNHQEIESI